MASSASSRFPVMFIVRRKIFLSYRLTSSSNAAASPALAAATKRCSSARATVDGRRCGFGVLNAIGVFTSVRFWPVLVMKVAQTGCPILPCVFLDDGAQTPDSGIVAADSSVAEEHKVEKRS